MHEIILTKLPYISVCNTNLPQAGAEVAAWLLSVLKHVTKATRYQQNGGQRTS